MELSRETDLNRWPLLYKSTALPRLSYPGVASQVGFEPTSNQLEVDCSIRTELLGLAQQY
jgi:hypothetical protein